MYSNPNNDMDAALEASLKGFQDSFAQLIKEVGDGLEVNKYRFYFDGRVGVIEIPANKVKERSSGNSLLELERNRWVRSVDVYETREQAEASPIALFVKRGEPTILSIPTRQAMPNNGIVRDKVNGTITRFEFVKNDCVPAKRYCMIDQHDMPIMSYDTVVKYYEFVK